MISKKTMVEHLEACKTDTDLLAVLIQNAGPAALTGEKDG